MKRSLLMLLDAAISLIVFTALWTVVSCIGVFLLLMTWLLLQCNFPGVEIEELTPYPDRMLLIISVLCALVGILQTRRRLIARGSPPPSITEDLKLL